MCGKEAGRRARSNPSGSLLGADPRSSPATTHRDRLGPGSFPGFAPASRARFGPAAGLPDRQATSMRSSAGDIIDGQALDSRLFSVRRLPPAAEILLDLPSLPVGANEI